MKARRSAGDGVGASVRPGEWKAVGANGAEGGEAVGWAKVGAGDGEGEGRGGGEAEARGAAIGAEGGGFAAGLLQFLRWRIVEGRAVKKATELFHAQKIIFPVS